MSAAKQKLKRRARIKARIRGKISGTATLPRLTVHRSNTQMYAQVIDDLAGVTLASASSRAINGADSVNKTEQAGLVGAAIAEKAQAAGIANVLFDRNGYLYPGRVKSLAEAARKGGLKF